MRILHLLQPLPPRDSWLSHDSRDLAHPDSRVSGEASLHLLRAVLADTTLPAEHVVLSLGPSPAREFTRAAGLRGVSHASPPLARAANAGPLLRRLLRRAGELDAILAWGPATAQPLAKIAPHARARAITLDPRTGALHRTFSAAPSLTLSALLPLAPLPPLALPSPTRPPDRAQARRTLQLSDHEVAIVALGDAAMPPDAVTLNLAAQSHAVTGRMLTLVIPSCSANLERALRHVHEMAFLYRVIVRDGPLAPILTACDAGVLVPAPAPTLKHPAFAASLWAQLWHSRAQGPLIAPVDLLDANISHTPARSARPTDLAGALHIALKSSAPLSPSPTADPITPGVALHRAVQHLLAPPIQSVRT